MVIVLAVWGAAPLNRLIEKSRGPKYVCKVSKNNIFKGYDFKRLRVFNNFPIDFCTGLRTTQR